MMFTRLSIGAAGVALSACASLPPDVTPNLIGVVLDQVTHRPISSATVRIKEFPQSAVKTASDGHFRIAPLGKWQAALTMNAMPGYQIVSEAPGYLRTVQHWDISDDRAQIVTLRRPNAIIDLPE